MEEEKENQQSTENQESTIESNLAELAGKAVSPVWVRHHSLQGCVVFFLSA